MKNKPKNLHEFLIGKMYANHIIIAYNKSQDIYQIEYTNNGIIKSAWINPLTLFSLISQDKPKLYKEMTKLYPEYFI